MRTIDELKRELARRGYRRANPVGKSIGGLRYFARIYSGIVPENLYKMAVEQASASLKKPDSFNCIRYEPGSAPVVALQFSPDFDTATEPAILATFSVSFDTVNRDLARKEPLEPADASLYECDPDDPPVWHHKWMWVADDYKGFDVRESMERSLYYVDHFTRAEKSVMGRKRSVWEKMLKDKGL